eukprot:9486550-Pyramimonas_sp.AAC.1
MAPGRTGGLAAADQRTWFCRFCIHQRTGEKFFNKPERDVYYQCRRSKGACFHNYKEHGLPVSVLVLRPTRP